MSTQQFLILFPLLAALVLLIARSDKLRGAIVWTSAGIIAIGSVVLAVQRLTAPAEFFAGGSEIASYAALLIDIVLGLYIFAMGVKHKKWLASVLALVQTVIVAWFETSATAHGIVIANGLYVDTLSVIMALIIGVIGSGICVYAVGYMRDFAEHHPEVPDRTHIFFAVMFAFLAAMFGVVFSNNLLWFFCAWEVTTVCSFILIGYTQTEEATRNAFLQIVMNLLGGLAFAVAIVVLGTQFGTLELAGSENSLLSLGLGGASLGVPVFLMAFAALTKAAQMPFHSWLLGAMVAPTPTSALLHSSTMVKAGVFLLVKLSPLLGMTTVSGKINAPGWTVMLIGGFTFMMCSMMAISQSNAKRVLAYSTIANLGLIAACAGIGTAEAIWAAIFLILFHAASKSLLFLCVGTAEHHIGSRDIEDMDGLFVKMPRLARFMALGICGMFVAPFGMLISKGAALGAFVDSGNVALVFMLFFGSAATFFFWAKWLGKITAVAGAPDSEEENIHTEEWSAIRLMGGLTALVAVLFPLISSTVIAPYLGAAFNVNTLAITESDLYIMAGMTVLIVVILALTTGKDRTAHRELPIYLAGVGAEGGTAEFKNSLGGVTSATQRNWYLTPIFGEARLTGVSTVIAIAVLICGFVAALLLGSVM